MLGDGFTVNSYGLGVEAAPLPVQAIPQYRVHKLGYGAGWVTQGGVRPDIGMRALLKIIGAISQTNDCSFDERHI